MRIYSSPTELTVKLFLILALMASTCHSAGAQTWSPDATLIDKVESSIKPNDIPMQYPKGHPPVISQYARYYLGFMANHHKMIRGELVLPIGSKMKPAGIYVVGSATDFPKIFDGGCAVIHVVYDVEVGRLVSVQCNGLA